MTPAARYAAAIDVLDRILGGEAAERALTNWGRANRFAGSGDRYAIRDHVFDALRCKRSYAALGGAETGRGLILGALRAAGRDAGEIFSGVGHAPAALTDRDLGRPPVGAEALDIPDWLYPRLEASLGDAAEATLLAMRHRAPVFLRVNAAKSTREAAQALLAQDGIEAEFVSGLKYGLKVIVNERKIQTSKAYESGTVDLQDASSQAVVEGLPLQDGMKVLDHCAGGGGKALAMAAAAGVKLFAHDHDPRRMRDIEARAGRAGTKLIVTENPEKSAPYDLVLTDVPCSGSGSWRRDPQGKWALTEDRLTLLRQTQAEILDRAARMVGKAGVLAYATCSLLREENEDQVSGFLSRNKDWQALEQKRFSPLDGGDGFFLSVLGRSA